MKILKIENCFSCPEYRDNRCKGPATGSTNDDMFKIPDWCPLEDYNESR